MLFLVHFMLTIYSGAITVMKYNGSSWVTVGSAGFSPTWVNSPAMAIDPSGTPYVVFEDGSGNKAIVMKYNGSSWINVGSPDFSPGGAWQPTIAIDGSGTPYVAFGDGSGSGAATVMKYNGSSWENVGSPNFSDSEAYNTSIVIDDSGIPYVAYWTYGSCQKATVMKYNGTSWVDTGSPCFSEGEPWYISMAIRGGTPYVFYADSINNFKATVMKYGFPTNVKNTTNPISSSLTLSPNPTHNSFTLYISSTQKEDATIIITNILGEKVKELVTITNTDTDVQLDASPGMYFVTAVTSQGKQSAKVVIW